jgi:sorting nexin-41/42
MIKQVLKYRHMKHLQMELTTDSLEKQKKSLVNLESSEQEAKRCEAALHKHGGTENLNRHRRLSAGDIGQCSDIGERGNGVGLEREQNGINDGNGKQINKRRSTLFSVLSHTLHGIMDVDPEASRRSSLGRTRESITQVCIMRLVVFYMIITNTHSLSGSNSLKRHL